MSLWQDRRDAQRVQREAHVRPAQVGDVCTTEEDFGGQTIAGFQVAPKVVRFCSRFCANLTDVPQQNNMNNTQQP
jgi:hypothetical protein